MFLSFNWQSNRLWYIVLFAVCFDIRYFFNFYLEDEPILSLIKAYCCPLPQHEQGPVGFWN